MREVHQDRADQLARLDAIDPRRRAPPILSGLHDRPGAHHVALEILDAHLFGERVQLEHLGRIDVVIGLGHVRQQRHEHVALCAIEIADIHSAPPPAGYTNGVNVHLLSPGHPDQRTGGYLFNARLVRGMRALGHSVWVHADPDRLGEGLVLADGLMWTHLGQRGARLAAERPVAVLLHSPLWREAGLALREPEEQALRRAALVIATSHRTASDLDVHAIVVEPGTDAAPPARGSGVGRLLCVATITPRKGHDVLLRALRGVPGPWELRCAGSVDRDPAWVASLGEVSGVSFLGELDDAALAAEYAAADVLVHPARYEGWGMALAEALVRGLPVVTTPAGIFDGRDPACRVEVPAGDPDALARALAAVLTDPGRRAELRHAALRVGLPGWPEQVARIAAALKELT